MNSDSCYGKGDKVILVFTYGFSGIEYSNHPLTIYSEMIRNEKDQINYIFNLINEDNNAFVITSL